MFCKNCGKQLPEGASFCPYCGTRVTPLEENKPEEPREAAPAPEVPKQEESKPEEPETPKPEENKPEEPQAAAPAPEVPKQEESKPEEPETPKPEESKPEEPKVTAPEPEAPKQEEESKPEEPKAADPEPEAPKQQESQAAPQETEKQPDTGRKPQGPETRGRQVSPNGTKVEAGQAFAGGSAAAAAAPRKPLSKKTTGIIAGIVCAVVAVILIAVLYKPTIDLSQYVTINFEGYNSVGTADADFDYDQMCADNEKIFSKYADTDLEDLEDWDSEDWINGISSGLLLSELEDPGSLDKTSDLSNGDSVTYHFDLDEETVKALEKELGCNLKFEDVTQEVAGLAEIEEVDAFESMVKVTFSGIAPDGTASVELDSELDNACYVDVEPSNGLSNGDTVTVTLEPLYSDEDYITLGDGGQVVRTLTKDYTVEGLDAYVTSADQITEDAIKAMDAQSQDVIKADWAYDDVVPTSITDAGYYLLTAKNADTWGAKNAVYNVYQVKVKLKSHDGANSKSYTYYTIVSYYNLIAGADGGITVDTSDYDMRGDSIDFTVEDGDGWDDYFYASGYEDLDDLYTSAIATQQADYTVEDKTSAPVSTSGSKDSSTEDSTEDASEEDSEEDLLDEDYILPDSDTKLLTEDDIKDLTLQELNYAKNEIYARHGRKFKSEELQDYFDSKDWYEGTIDPEDFDESVLSSTEKKNAAFLAEAEYAMDPKGYQLDQ